MDEVISTKNRIKEAKQNIRQILPAKDSILLRATDIILKDFPFGEVFISKAELYGSFDPFHREAALEHERIYTKAHRKMLAQEYETKLIEVFNGLVIHIKFLLQSGKDLKNFMFEIQKWVIKKSMSLTFDEGLKSFYPHFTGYINKTLSQESHVPKSVLYKVNSPKNYRSQKKVKNERQIQEEFSFEEKLLKVTKKYSFKKFFFDPKNKDFFLDELTNSFELLAASIELHTRLVGFKKKLTIEYANRVNSSRGHVAGGFCEFSFTISLSEYCDARTFFHEWAHAFDYFLGEKVFPGESIALSELRDKKSLFIPIEYRSILSQLDDFYVIIADRIRDSNLYWQHGKDFQEYILNKSEIFARAFEKCVHLRLIQKGMLNSYQLESYSENSFTPTDDEILVFTQILDQLVFMYKDSFD